MIKKVYIDNFRTFDNFECDLGMETLVMGSNGVGKSSLLDVLSYLRDFIVFGVIRDSESRLFRFGSGSFTRWSAKSIQTFELTLDINGVEYVYRLKIDEYGKPRRPRTILEEVVCDGATIFKFEDGIVHLFNDYTLADKVQYPFDWHQAALSTIYSRADNQKVMSFKGAMAKFIQLKPNPWAIKATSKTEDTLLVSDAGNFSSWYRHIRQMSEIDCVGEYIKDLKRIIPELKDLTIRGEGEEARELVVRPRVTETVAQRDYVLPIVDMSEGQRMLIVLYAVLHFLVQGGATICLDEPDNFLSLKEVQPFLSQLLSRAEDFGCQVVITSHHPEVLNCLAKSSGKVFKRENGMQTRVTPFSSGYGDTLEPSEIVARDWE